MNRWIRRGIVAVAFSAATYNFIDTFGIMQTRTNYSQFLKSAQNGDFKNIAISPSQASAINKAGQKISAAIPAGENFMARIDPAKISVSAKDNSFLNSELAAFLMLFFAFLLVMREYEKFKETRPDPQLVGDDEENIIAHHEAGHALVALLLDNYAHLAEVTIIPGHGYGGYAAYHRKKQFRITDGDKDGFFSELAVTMGGRVAEEIIFGDKFFTTGAQTDIRKATLLARKMVTRWGMSEIVGPVNYEETPNFIIKYLKALVGQENILETRKISEITQQKIDAEIERILKEAKETARNLLSENISKVEKLANALKERGTLSGDEITKLLDISEPALP